MTNANVKTILELVLKAEPELTPFGFDTFRGRSDTRRESREDYEARIVKDRARFRLDEFEAALDFCRDRLTKIKTINNRIGSYGLKHIVERECGLYIPNGGFIAAAIAAGFTYKRYIHSGPNCCFNISTRSIHEIAQAAEERQRRRWERERIAASRSISQ